MFAQPVNRRLERERPRWPLGDEHRITEVIRQGTIVFADQALGRSNTGQLIRELLSAKHRRVKTTRGKLGPGDANFVFAFLSARHNGRKIVAFAGVEQRFVGQRSRCHDARDLAFDEPFGELGIFDLLTDRGPMSGGDDLGQIAVQLMVGKTRHRDRVLALIATG